MGAYAGVDFGATTIRTAVADADGSIRAEASGPTPPGPDGETVTTAIIDRLEAACANAGMAPTDLAGVGVGTIGTLDLSTGAVVNPANLPDSVDRIRVHEAISSLVDGSPVRIQNDAVAGVLAERAAGSYTHDDLVYLTISSGIGAGICVDGQVLTGRDGNVGEVGHLTVDPSGTMTCGCGAPGHWEAYCSGENIPRYARRRQADTGIETDLPLEGALTAADVFAATDDPLARDVLEQVGRWNTVGFAAVTAAYAPEVIAVGGAVALNNPRAVLEPVRRGLGDHVFGPVPEIRPTGFGGDVVLRGALASVLPEAPAWDVADAA